RSTASPTVAPYLVFYPLPNGAVSGLTGIFTFAGQQVTPEDFFTTRIDHKLTDRGSLHGSYMFDNGKFTQPDSLNDLFLLSHTRRQAARADHTKPSNPPFITSFRFGVRRLFASIRGPAPV